MKSTGRLVSYLGGVIALAAASLPACGDDDENGEPTREKVTLTSAMEVPPPVGATSATGTFEYELDDLTGVMTYTLMVSNLTGPVTAAHIHKAAVGTAGPVVVPLVTPTEGSITGSTTAGAIGTATLSPDLIVDLKAGNLYVNVHTDMNAPGEIRGQLDGR